MSMPAIAKGKPAAPGKTWIHLTEAARRLETSLQMIQDLIADGRLSVRRLRHWRTVNAEEVEQIDREAVTPARARPDADEDLATLRAQAAKARAGKAARREAAAAARS
jgi:hypothetical protein